MVCSTPTNTHGEKMAHQGSARIWVSHKKSWSLLPYWNRVSEPQLRVMEKNLLCIQFWLSCISVFEFLAICMISFWPQIVFSGP
jgi:hypothetical protein